LLYVERYAKSTQATRSEKQQKKQRQKEFKERKEHQERLIATKETNRATRQRDDEPD